MVSTVSAFALAAALLACGQEKQQFQTKPYIPGPDTREPRQQMHPEEPGKQAAESAETKGKPATMDMTEVVQNLHWYGTAILLLTLLTLVGEFCVIIRGNIWRGWDSLRVIVVTLIIGVGGFLVVAGYSANQLGVITGIFGAIVGYLFGKEAPAERPPPVEPRAE